jgi:hypothetical protein
MHRLHESRIADHIGCKNAGEAAVDAFFGHEVLLSERSTVGFYEAPIRSLVGSISGMGHDQPIEACPWLVRSTAYSGRITAERPV